MNVLTFFKFFTLFFLIIFLVTSSVTLYYIGLNAYFEIILTDFLRSVLTISGAALVPTIVCCKKLASNKAC